MSNTQKFAEIDKIAEGVYKINEKEEIKIKNGIISGANVSVMRDADNPFFEKHPQLKKWKKTLRALPKKEQEEYTQEKKILEDPERPLSYLEEHFKELCKHNHPYAEEWLQNKLGEASNLTEQECRDAYPEIGPQDLSKKRTIFFTFAEAGKKKNLFRGFNFAHQQVQLDIKNNKLKDGSESKLANLFIPETVTIDYSEHSNVPIFKDNVYTKPYKDGIMLVTDVEKGNRICIALTVGSANLGNSQVDGKIVLQIFENSFRNYGQINWTDKRFDDQVVFYVVIPKIAKNKAVRIVFKNNIHLSKMIKHFRSEQQRKLPPGKFKHFYDSTTMAHTIISNLHLCRTEKDPTKATNLKKNHDYSNKELLNVGYQSVLVELANNCVLTDDKNMDTNFWMSIEEYENKSLKEIKQEYMRDVFPFEKNIKEKFSKKNFLKMVIIYYHTNKGTTLCNGTEVNVNTKTKSDCILFWKKIDLFELLFNVLNDKNFPLCLRNSQVINDTNIFDPILAPYLNFSPIDDVTAETVDGFNKIESLGTVEHKKKALEALKGKKDQKPFLFKNKHILAEAVNNQTGHYKVPYDGVFELLHDPFFKCIRFREDKDVVTAIVLDKNERYLIEVFSKAEVDFKYMLWNQMKSNKHYSEECMQEIYTKIATVIRDSYVLIERDRTMGYGGRRRPYGMNTGSEYNIYYFPRKRYRYKNNTKAEKAFFRETRTFGGTRRAHIRELPGNCTPSKKQMLLAKSLDIWVPDRCTFVKEAEWGVKMTKREVRYRHTCLNDVFYYDNKEVSKAQEINQLSPAGFEEYCEKRVKKLGYSIKSNFEDRGIDIRAIKILDNDKTEYLLVQCKHPRISNKPISPGAMRDFSTACDDEPSEYKKVKIFMTSSTFSPGARELAEKHNIKLIDGDDLLK